MAIWLGSACWLCLHASADVASGDAGEIGGAAWTLGVAHPTGFALDLLWLRAAALWPLGSIAFRQNVAVSLLGACAVTCVARLTYATCHKLRVTDPWSAAFGACSSALALLGARTLFLAATSVEVYATALLWLAVAAYWVSDTHGARVLWPWCGLALGAHITAPYLIAPLALSVLLRTGHVPLRGLVFRALSCCTGALIVAYIPLAALRGGPFNWGDPRSWHALVRHLSAARIREAYAAELWSSAPAPHFGSQLLEQPWWLLLALFGLVAVWRQQRSLALAWLAIFSLDLAYAVWINPMGIAARQVGHASFALRALAAGSGAAVLHAWWLQQLSPRWARSAAVSGSVA
ncbi:MAG: hypothetical protein RL701_7955, partial [Pseudomonadota bacterium]